MVNLTHIFSYNFRVKKYFFQKVTMEASVVIVMRRGPYTLFLNGLTK